MFARAILHFDLDAFFAAVECRDNDALKGRPLIIGGGSRGVVASCSYEARTFGVRSAMPVKMALRLCPDAIVLRGDMERYSRASRLVTEIIAGQAPLFEKASIDEFYLDLSGMDRYIGCWKWSNELRQRIMHEAGLPISMGLSVNKLVSKVGAGEAKPNGALKIDTGVERAFLAPLPVGKLPGVGQETDRKLRLMGVRTVQILSDIPPGLLQREFGQPGLDLWRKANAEDDSPVVPFRDPKSMSSEHTFHADTTDLRRLNDQLTTLVSRLAFDLRQARKLTACVTVKIRYADFNTYTRQKRIPHTAQDVDLLRIARELFQQLYERRQSLRLIGVQFSHLVHGFPQLDLFEQTAEENQLLERLDHLRRRFGQAAVKRASMLTGN